MGSIDKDEKIHLCSVWAKKLKSACEEDEWGQVLDAAEQYESVMKSIASSVLLASQSDTPLNKDVSNSNRVNWEEDEIDFLQNAALCLKQRLDVIQSPISKDKQFPRDNVSQMIEPLSRFTLEFPKSLQQQLNTQSPSSSTKPQSKSTSMGESNSRNVSANSRKVSIQNNQILAKLQGGKLIEMDSGIDKLQRRRESVDCLDGGTNQSSGSEDYDDGIRNMATGSGDSNGGQFESVKNVIVAVSRPGNLLPPIPKKPGETLLTVKILKVGLKDASKLSDTFWTVSVKDVNGFDITEIQETPSFGTSVDPQTIVFNSEVHIQKSLEHLPKTWAIFLELKHLKPSKKGCNISVKCWAMLESDELDDNVSRVQNVVCELYKKPTDFKRKKMSLLTTKELYLHLELIKTT